MLAETLIKTSAMKRRKRLGSKDGALIVPLDLDFPASTLDFSLVGSTHMEDLGDHVEDVDLVGRIDATKELILRPRNDVFIGFFLSTCFNRQIFPVSIVS